jgi:hypothetical protein
VAKEEKRRSQRKKAKEQTFRRVIGIEVIHQRQEEAQEKEFLRVWQAEFFKIDLDIFTESITTWKTRKPAAPKKRKALETVKLVPKRRVRLEIAL